jgi:hypothetical protein
VERDEIVAAHARAPRAVDLRDTPPSSSNVAYAASSAVAAYGLPFSSQRLSMCVAPRHITLFTPAEQVVEDVAPVAQHVDDDAAVVFLAVIPRRSLRRLASRPRTPSIRTLPRTERMRPKKPESISIRSLSRPGSHSLSCTTPCLTFAASARRYRSTASASVGATGFSV